MAELNDISRPRLGAGRASDCVLDKLCSLFHQYMHAPLYMFFVKQTCLSFHRLYDKLDLVVMKTVCRGHSSYRVNVKTGIWIVWI